MAGRKWQVGGNMNDLLTRTNALLADERPGESVLLQILSAVLAEFKSETGTIHRLDSAKKELHLMAQVGLPPALLEVVKTIPVGKGIAGQVVARGGPVTICNLQSDKSGVAQPGAKQTGVGGALCVPVRANGIIVGTIGVGTAREYEYTAEETKTLEEVGRILGKTVGEGPR
jgi:GAF domain-containing protein